MRAKYVTAVKNVSFEITATKPVITALVGESGSGKTTIARMILGLTEPTSGEILYRGKSVGEWLKEDPKRFRREVQAVFQDPYSTYNPFYRVDRVLHLAIKKFELASSKKEADQAINKALRALGLRPEDILGRYPHQLSGGERQRLMLVRALLIRPQLLVADEPISMVDASLRAIFLNNLRQLKEEYGLSCLYITHDLHSSRYISDEVVVLYAGKVVEMGIADKLFERPLHPYTRCLLESVPIPDPRARWKERLSVEIATFREARPETGCPYYPRCPYVTEECKQVEPTLLEVEEGHKVACIMYTKGS